MAPLSSRELSFVATRRTSANRRAARTRPLIKSPVGFAKIATMASCVLTSSLLKSWLATVAAGGPQIFLTTQGHWGQFVGASFGWGKADQKTARLGARA